MHILVTYDVDTTSKEGARRLRHVAKACIDYGQRVQNSVFECEVTEAQYCLLIERIKRIIDILSKTTLCTAVFYTVQTEQAGDFLGPGRK